MRITYLHQYFNTPVMSGGSRSYEMARRLVASGHEVHMITSDRTNQSSDEWYRTRESGIEVHWLPVSYSNEMPYHRRILAFLRFAVKTSHYASRIGADIIFATSTPLTIAIPAICAASRLRIPMVFEVRDLWPDIPIAIGALKGPFIPPARLLERCAYRHSSAVVALSPGMKEGVLRTGYPARRIHVIPNGCDLGLFQVPAEAGIAFRNRYAWLGERPLVIYAGTFGRINDVAYLARLAREAWSLDPEVRFLAVGAGYEFNTVETLSRELGVLNRNFFMMSPIPKAEIPALFSAATISTSTVLDMPQLWRNSANKFFDSLAAGRPVAINYEGWQAELLRRTKAGLILPARDLPTAARLLTKTLRDPAWLERAGKAALSLALSHFSRDHLALQLETLLLDTVHTHRTNGDAMCRPGG